MDGNYGTARRTAGRAALTALLALLLAPAGATASVSVGPAAQLPGVVQGAGESLSQVGAGVDRGVSETLASARRAGAPVAGSVPSTPVPPVEVAPTIDRVAPCRRMWPLPRASHRLPFRPLRSRGRERGRAARRGARRRRTGSHGSPRTPARAAAPSARPYASPAARPGPPRAPSPGRAQRRPAGSRPPAMPRGRDRLGSHIVRILRGRLCGSPDELLPRGLRAPHAAAALRRGRAAAAARLRARTSRLARAGCHQSRA